MTDLLVVGGGLGGGVAALAAARENPSAQIRLVVPSDDRFDYHPGLVDVLGYLPNDDTSPEESENGQPDDDSQSPTPVERPLAAIPNLPATHPYRRLGTETVRDALDLFDSALDYQGGHAERNALVVTQRGRLRPAARYPAGMAAGVASREEPMRLVGIDQVPDFDAELAADRLDARLPYAVESSAIDFPGDIREYPSAPVLAAALDDDEVPTSDAGGPMAFAEAMGDAMPGGEGLMPGDPPDDMDGMMPDDPPGAMDELMGADDAPEGPLRETLVDRLRPALDIEGRIGLPAVLGESAHQTVRAELSRALQAEVFEIPVGPPSIPGRRLEARLHDALAEAGVTVEHGEVEGFDAGDRIERVRLSDGVYEPESVVLATGGVDASGLVADERVHERVFGCHIPHPEDRAAWTAEAFLGDHAFARFGVEVDEQLRPVDSRGNAEYENLRAVGRILGGVDYDAELSDDGVGIATGYAAGRWALP